MVRVGESMANQGQSKSIKVNQGQSREIGPDGECERVNGVSEAGCLRRMCLGPTKTHRKARRATYRTDQPRKRSPLDPATTLLRRDARTNARTKPSVVSSTERPSGGELERHLHVGMLRDRPQARVHIEVGQAAERA